jgi:hypothetical protein
MINWKKFGQLKMKKSSVLAFLLLLNSLVFAQSNYWKNSAEPSEISSADRWIIPEKYSTFELDIAQLKANLKSAPEENIGSRNGILIEIPMPDGSFKKFSVYHSSIMAPDLAKQFPEIDTWRGQGIDDATESVHLDITLKGFHAMILSPNGSVFIDPYANGNTKYYISYNKKDLKAKAKFFEEGVLKTETNNIGNKDQSQTIAPYYSPNNTSNLIQNRSNGLTLKTYRLALAATFEYTAFHGGTVALALSAMVTSVNRVVGVYRTEIGVSLTLVSNTSSLIYTTSADPYTNTSGSTMLGQNITNVNNIIGSANYDIGHVYSTGGGGVAYLASVCTSNKAGGVTGSSSPVNDAFDIDYVAHEMGHQFGGNHTFNGTTGSCSGSNRNATTAYEPGSGSTIMAYAGICTGQNLQPNSDPYFHTINFDEIITNITTGSASACAVSSASNNQIPTCSIGKAAYTIPFGTPFMLTGSGSDPDNDSITYCWEQMNLGTATAPNSPPNPGPRFRTYNPSTSPSRTIPEYNSLLNNVVPVGEILSTAAQTLTFRLTVRDNRSNCGGVYYDPNNVTVTVASTGPFSISNSPVFWSKKSKQVINWNLASTNVNPINCANVKISLSTDGGLTFPYVLSNSTSNDGSDSVVVPDVVTQSARIKIEAIGNIFFALSTNNFTIDELNAGLFATLGTGTGSNTGTTYPAPYGSYFGGAKHQLIYRASELTAMGLNKGIITQFGFNVSTLVSGSLTSFTIGMKNSTVSDLTSAWQTGFTTVLNSNTLTPKIGWNMHTLNFPFYWDGTSNILVEVCFNNNNAGTATSSLTTMTTGLPTGTSRWYTADNTATVCSGTAVTTTGSTSRPNARMYIIVEPTVNSSNLQVTNIGNTSATLTWTAGNGRQRLVVVRESSLLAYPPDNFNTYLASPNISMSQVTGYNNFVIYNDTGNTVTVNGLSLNTNYSVDIYEYNGTNGNYVYKTTPLTGSFQTIGNCVFQVNNGADSLLTCATSTNLAYQSGFTFVAAQYKNNGVWQNTNTINTNGSISVPISQTGWYKIQVSGSNGCIGLDSAYATIGSLGKPDLQLSADSVFCQGNTVSLSVNSQNNANYKWYETNSNTLVGNSNTLLINTAGKYRIIVQSIYGCSDTSRLQQIIVNSIPSNTYTLTGSNFICNTCSTEVVLNNPSGTIYTWNKNNLFYKQDTISKVQLSDEGTYTFTAKSISNCYSTSAAPFRITKYYTSIVLPDSAITCQDDSILLEPGFGFASVKWNTPMPQLSAAYLIPNNPDDPDALVNGSIVAKKTGWYFIEAKTLNGNTINDSVYVQIGCNVILNVKVFIQSLYLGNQTMSPVLLNASPNFSSNLTDSIEIALHESTGSFNQIFKQKGIVDINGNIQLNIPPTALNNAYYLVVNYKNAISTWSKNPVTMTSITNYDFSSAMGQAYGDNLIDDGNGVFLIYSGDINQDGFIDGNDFIDLDNDNANFVSGYTITDVNGDGFVDGNDFIILDNNNANFIGIVRP